MEGFARQIIESVGSGIAEVRAGRIIGSSEPGHWDVPTAKDFNGTIPAGLLAEVSRLFTACAHKFEHYLDARRIVVIDQHGDIRYQGAWWWKRILDAVSPPSEINELWDGMFDWLDDYEQGWVFEKLYPIDPLPPLANPLQPYIRQHF